MPLVNGVKQRYLSELGTLIWRQRRAARMSQGEIARRLGVSRSLVSRWEQGRVEMSVTQLEALRRTLEGAAR